MYVLSLIVWSALGVAPAVDTSFKFKTFTECEERRLKYNETYEQDMKASNIVGYETSCVKEKVSK